MLCGVRHGGEPALTPLRVVFTGERRKGKAGEKRQHLRTQISQLCLFLTAGKQDGEPQGVERRRDSERRQEKRKEKRGRVGGM